MSYMSDRATAGYVHAFYKRYFEYARVITRVSVTDQGIYQYGEVPAAYGGAQLDLNVVNAVYMVNSKMEMEIFEFEADEVKDRDDKIGGPIYRDGVLYRNSATASNSSAVPVVQTTVINSRLDQNRARIGASLFALFKAAQ